MEMYSHFHTGKVISIQGYHETFHFAVYSLAFEERTIRKRELIFLQFKLKKTGKYTVAYH